ncbi:MAG TPA: Xaa-Pro peptidase family protein [Planctomycetota bacterium]|nr:Xaa-Pro peptidase family protein [Planctomycetota bacterium]
MPRTAQKKAVDYIQRRQSAVRREIAKRGLDALLITNPHNVGYLCGFTGGDSWAIVTADYAALLTDSRYTEQAQNECRHCQVLERTGYLHDLCKEGFRRLKARNAGFESHHVTFRQWSCLQDSQIEWQPTFGIVESQRIVKDAGEIESILRAVNVAQAAFNQVQGLIKPGVTELEIAHAIDGIQRQLGASGSSFEPIVSFGERGSLPHGQPGARVLQPAEPVLIDWGARVGLYNSDLTRVLLPSKINSKLKRIYQTVLHAQRAAIDAAKPGMTGQQLDAIARKVIEKARFGRYFGHGLGHGVGLEVHEAPALSRFSNDQLSAGAVVTIEPGIYLAGWGGVRIEDMILLTRTGRKVLTSLPKNMDEVCVL